MFSPLVIVAPIAMSSEQDLVSCETDNYGCNGGFPYKAMAWVEQNNIDTEATYPYNSGQGHVPACAAQKHEQVGKEKKGKRKRKRKEKERKKAKGTKRGRKSGSGQTVLLLISYASFAFVTVSRLTDLVVFLPPLPRPPPPPLLCVVISFVFFFFFFVFSFFFLFFFPPPPPPHPPCVFIIVSFLFLFFLFFLFFFFFVFFVFFSFSPSSSSTLFGVRPGKSECHRISDGQSKRGRDGCSFVSHAHSDFFFFGTFNCCFRSPQVSIRSYLHCC